MTFGLYVVGTVIETDRAGLHDSPLYGYLSSLADRLLEELLALFDLSIHLLVDDFLPLHPQWLSLKAIDTLI